MKQVMENPEANDGSPEVLSRESRTHTDKESEEFEDEANESD